MRLEGRVAIVTGGGNGIGRATSLLFAKEGAAVVIADWDGDAAKAAERDIKSQGGRALAVQVDVSKKAQVESMVQAALKEFGQVDIEANIAGITGRTEFLEITEEKLSAMLDVHVKGTFFCIQAVAPHMIKRQYGKIVNTSSISGIKGQANNVHYSAAKAAILGLTMALAAALGPHCITVNAVVPGALTQMTRGYTELAEFIKYPPRKLGRFGTPEEVAPAYLFLASSESDYITGDVIYAIGGGHLR